MPLSSFFATFLAEKKVGRCEKKKMFFHFCPIKIGRYFLCPFVLILRQAQYKYKRMGSAPLGSARCPLSESSGAQRHLNQTTHRNVAPRIRCFAVSLSTRNFLHPHFANRDKEKMNSKYRCFGKSL